MATPTIPNGEEYFFPIIYSGNGQAQRVGNFVPFTDNGSISKSALFFEDDTDYLYSTQGQAGTSRKIYSVSCWVKLASEEMGDERRIVMFGPSGNDDGVRLSTDNKIEFWQNGTIETSLKTETPLLDTSKWYHIMLVVDTRAAVAAADKVKIYLDGDLQTYGGSPNYPGDDYEGAAGQNGVNFSVGNSSGAASGEYFDGYLAEFNYVDGTALTPDTFGVTDTSTGRWIPKALTGITYGNNGVRLAFGTGSALGTDTSGNGHNLTASSNLNDTNHKQRGDSPTNNMPTIRNYSQSYKQTLKEGNLQHSTTGINTGYPVVSTLRPKGSGKYYAECRISTTPGGYTITVGCYAQEDLHNYSSGNAYPGNANLGSGLWIAGTNYLKHNGTTQSNPSFTFSAEDVIGLALDLDNGTLSFYDDDNGLIGTIPYDKTKSACFCAQSNKAVTFIWNFGDNPTFNGEETAGGNADGDGNGNFFKSVPTGFKQLSQDSMPTTGKGVSGLVWTKNRDTTDSHQLYDSSRGKQLVLASNATSAESTVTGGVQKFLQGGQSIGDDVSVNTDRESFVSWNWVGNGGTTVTNDASETGVGDIDSVYQANTTAGFSIVTYTGTGSAGEIAHGLSSAPEVVMAKSRSNDTGDSFSVYHIGMTSASYYLRLGGNNAEASASTVWNGATPTGSVFSVGTATGTNTNTYTYLSYCWHGVDGFSKFGKYTGSGGDTFIYTGFSPALVVIKKASGGTFGTGDSDWMVFDNVTDFNQTTYRQYNRWNLSNAESYTSDLPFLANGFMVTGASNSLNATSGTYIYMAFAKNPFVGDGTSPMTAV